ncbi:hypothetical protein PoB_006805100 [Plakobranchus ocellatus]|uniref:Uncharacterized protein n=1 Tax=Plakobranchus ocellatus TaxID=259542 RepID=A0AAV4DBM9_9GAST|nr:hypothetical protein PoB_006805100 [Plakobranchus ocellatus]
MVLLLLQQSPKRVGLSFCKARRTQEKHCVIVHSIASTASEDSKSKTIFSVICGDKNPITGNMKEELKLLLMSETMVLDREKHLAGPRQIKFGSALFQHHAHFFPEEL